MRRCLLGRARARGASSGPTVATAAGPFDPYKILGIPHSSSQEDAKKAYHKLALRFHPDAAEGNKERFQAVQEAHEAIKNGWTPTDRRSEGGEGDGKHWGSKSSYVYEEPGSTTENYVSSNPSLERNLQMLMWTCFAVFMIRMVMHMMSRPANDQANAAHPFGAPDISGVMHSGAAPPSTKASVHDEDDAEWRRHRERTGSNDSSTGVFRFDRVDGK